MAKGTIEERRLKILAELEKVDAEIKKERAGRQTKLGALAEEFLKGDVDIQGFVDKAEAITGWKFKGSLAGKKGFGNQVNTENPTAV